MRGCVTDDFLAAADDSAAPLQWLERPDGPRLAYHALPATTSGLPTVVFCGGFLSNMSGGKASYLQEQCRARGQGCVRFDYRGHGQSAGRFVDATVGHWLDDARAILDHASAGPILLVGSSMGGWIAVLLALARPQRIAGVVTVAAAPDMTEVLLRPQLSEEQCAALAANGVIHVPSRYDDGPYPITAALLEEGREHLVLDQPIPVACPARLIHGMADPDVPWRLSLRLAEALSGRDVRLILVKDGEHRLSREADLELLWATVAELSTQLYGD